MFAQNGLKNRRNLGILILASLLLITTIGHAGAARPMIKIQGKEWWRNTISFTASLFAVVVASYALIDLGVEHPGFWPTLLISGMLVSVGFYAIEFEQSNINFWLSLFVGLGLAAVAISSVIVALTGKSLQK